MERLVTRFGSKPKRNTCFRVKKLINLTASPCLNSSYHINRDAIAIVYNYDNICRKNVVLVFRYRLFKQTHRRVFFKNLYLPCLATFSTYNFAVVRSSGTGPMLTTAGKCDAAGYENPKPLCGKRERIPPTNATPPTLGAEV